MPPRNIFLSISFAAVLVVLAFFAAKSIPSSAVPPTTLTSDPQHVPTAPTEAQTEVGIFSSTSTDPAESTAAPPPDGPSLLRSRCTQCHLAPQPEQTTKTRAEWEWTLTKMERLGVPLNEAERIILLDYLAVSDAQ